MSNYCPECGKQLEENSDFCSNCGTKINPEAESAYEQQQTQNNGNNSQQSTQSYTTYEQPNIVRNQKNAGLAAVLSFLIIGLGQIYNGEIAKGLILLVVSYLCIALAFLIIPLIVGIVLWIYAIYDAYDTAKKINEGLI